MSYAAKLTKCEAEVARLTAELAAMRGRCGRYERALKAIAGEDYRGNRPQSAVTAHEALKETSDG